jgi:hypothetical protein
MEPNYHVTNLGSRLGQMLRDIMDKNFFMTTKYQEHQDSKDILIIRYWAIQGDS